MKTLDDHVILYDPACPLCQAYTGAFVATGMLDNQGRQAFGEISGALKEQIDYHRAKDEIALVDKASGGVSYGIDSLFKILAHRWPVFQRLFAWGPFRWLIQQLYWFITFNRKVIAPGRVPERLQACVPHFNAKWRWVYILFMNAMVALLVSGTLVQAGRLFQLGSLGTASIFILPFVLFRLLYWSLMLRRQSQRQRLAYLGNMTTVSFIGAVAFIATQCVNGLLGATVAGVYAGLVFVALLLPILHYRRLRTLELPWRFNLLWALYPALFFGGFAGFIYLVQLCYMWLA